MAKKRRQNQRLSVPAESVRFGRGRTQEGKTSSDRLRPKIRVNVALLSWLVGTIVVFGIGAVVLRNYFVDKNATVLLSQAADLEDKNDYSGAVRLIEQYISFRPNDSEAKIRLAEVYDKTVRSPSQYFRALNLYSDALGSNPNIDKLREKQCEYLYLVEEYSRAMDVAEQLLRSSPTNPVGLAVLARAMREQIPPLGRIPVVEVARAFQQAREVEENRLDTKLAVDSAKFIRDHMTDSMMKEYNDKFHRNDNGLTREQRADAIVDEQVALRPESVECLLAQYRYRMDYELPGASESLQKAVKLAPEDLEVRVAQATLAARENDIEKSLKLWNQIIKQAPDDGRGYLGVAQVLVEDKKYVEAISTLEAGLKTISHYDLRLQLMLGYAHLQNGQFDLASQDLGELEAALPRLQEIQTQAGRMRAREAVDRLHGELLLAQGKLFEGISILRKLTTPSAKTTNAREDREIEAGAWVRLGETYARLEQWDLAALAYEQAATRDAEPGKSRLAAAVAWEKARRFTYALDQYNLAVNSEGCPTEAWIFLASAELQRQAMKSRDRRFNEFETAIANALEKHPNSATVYLLRAQADALQQRSEQARIALDRAVQLDPAKSLPSATLMYDALGDEGAADSALDRLSDLGYSRDRIDLIQVELLYRRGQAEDAIRILQEVSKNAKGQERQMALHRLSNLYVDEGQPDKALEVLREWNATEPKNLHPLQQLADTALYQDRTDDLKKWADSIREVEGESGTLWRYYQGMYLVQVQGDYDGEQFRAARQLQHELETVRPAWPMTFVLKGRILAQSGRVEEAADEFKRAITLGAQTVTIFEWLASLLYQDNRWAEATQFLERLQDSIVLSSRLATLAPELVVQTSTTNRGLRMARSGAKLRPKDPYSHLWLGQSLTIAAEYAENKETRDRYLAEAKSEFEQSIELGTTDYRTHAGLLWYWTRLGNTVEARKVLETIKNEVSIEEPHRSIALGTAHMMIGDLQQADAIFTKVSADYPNDPVVQERVAKFYVTVNPEKALAAFERLAKLLPNSKAARRALAAQLAATGDPDNMRRAMEDLLGGASGESADQRLQAILYFRRGGASNLEAAKSIMARLINAQTNPDPGDRWLLAAIYEAQKDTEGARMQLKEAVDDPLIAPVYLGTYIEFLLRNKLLDAAVEPLDRMHKIEPSAVRYIRLKARWMSLTGEPKEAIKQLVESFLSAQFTRAKNSRERAAIYLNGARVYSYAEVDELVDETFKTAMKEPELMELCYESYASWLGDKRRVQESIDVCQNAFAQFGESPRAASKLASVLIQATGRDPMAEFPEADVTFQKTLAKFPDNIRFIYDLATLRHMQAKYPEAEKLYRSVLSLKPDHLPAKNNLALLLSEKPRPPEQVMGSDESLLIIQNAISAGGNSAELKDTLALVLINIGQPAEARAILNQVLTDFGGNARYYFHLAAASLRAGNIDEAKAAMEEARIRNINGELLTPGERELLRMLESTLQTSQ